ncbi:MAG: hypothetical protein J4N87_07555, partial [Chloroflexi bacterium]|nr:hypothetical protein [Chloroflexota bacterium]
IGDHHHLFVALGPHLLKYLQLLSPVRGYRLVFPLGARKTRLSNNWDAGRSLPDFLGTCPAT